MISIRAEIHADGGLMAIEGKSYMSTNNVSSSYKNVLNRNYKASSPFLLGSSKFGEKKTYVDETLDYYIGNIVGDEKGSFGNYPYVFDIGITQPVECFFIFFDVLNNEYPPEIRVNDLEYKLNSPIFVVPIDEYFSPTTLRIDRWNKPNRPLVIQGISLNASLPQITKLSFGGQDRSDPLRPSWGIKTNSGSMTFVDSSGIISQLKLRNRIKNLPISIYLSAREKEELITKSTISMAIQETGDRISEIEFEDILPSWESTKVEETNAIFERKMSAWDFAKNEIRRFAIEPFDAETEEHLRNIVIEAPIIQEGSAWATIVKFCELAQCYVYVDKGNKPIIKYDRGF